MRLHTRWQRMPIDWGRDELTSGGEHCILEYIGQEVRQFARQNAKAIPLQIAMLCGSGKYSPWAESEENNGSPTKCRAWRYRQA
jgi:hypothetical protein